MQSLEARAAGLRARSVTGGENISMWRIMLAVWAVPVCGGGLVLVPRGFWQRGYEKTLKRGGRPARAAREGDGPMVLNDHIRVMNGDMYPPGICP